VVKADFQNAVKMADLFARDSADIVKLGVDGDAVSLSATSQEMGDTAGEVKAAVEGDPVEIAFNAKYLLDAIGAVQTNCLALDLIDHQSPGVVRMEKSGQDCGKWICVIMPMHLTR